MNVVHEVDSFQIWSYASRMGTSAIGKGHATLKPLQYGFIISPSSGLRTKSN